MTREGKGLCSCDDYKCVLIGTDGFDDIPLLAQKLNSTGVQGLVMRDHEDFLRHPDILFGLRDG